MTEAQFKAHLQKKLSGPLAHWQSIETTTGRGVPDVNLCYRGTELWMELKVGKKPEPILRPEQFAWAIRRFTAGGNCCIVMLEDNDPRFLSVFLAPYNDVRRHGKYVKVHDQPLIRGPLGEVYDIFLKTISHISSLHRS